MADVIWMNLEKGVKNELSNKACAMLFQLMMNIDKNNEVNKGAFLSSIPWIRDRRTANKYWKELVDNGVLVHLERRIWMVSPYECYSAGVMQTELVRKWEAVCS